MFIVLIQFKPWCILFCMFCSLVVIWYNFFNEACHFGVTREFIYWVITIFDLSLYSFDQQMKQFAIKVEKNLLWEFTKTVSLNCRSWRISSLLNHFVIIKVKHSNIKFNCDSQTKISLIINGNFIIFCSENLLQLHKRC